MECVFRHLLSTLKWFRQTAFWDHYSIIC